jgi:hypothetical protein
MVNVLDEHNARSEYDLPHHVQPHPDPPAEAYALFAQLRAFLYRLPEEHPSRPGLHAAAVAAYCTWRESMAQMGNDATGSTRQRMACAATDDRPACVAASVAKRTSGGIREYQELPGGW